MATVATTVNVAQLPPWQPHPDVPEPFRTKLLEIAEKIPPAHRLPPEIGETYDDKEKLKTRLQDYAFFEGFVIGNSGRNTISTSFR